VEPIASSGAGAAFRPTTGAGTELSALLRDGRVLKAEVLSSSADGTVLLAIGRHTIPAESELRLDRGTRFLVRVEEGADGVVLRHLVPAEAQDGALLRALRGLVGEERPLGERLFELAEAVRAALRRGELPPALRTLGERIPGFVAAPGSDGAVLRALLASLGHGHEFALASLLGTRAGREALSRLRGDLKALLVRAQFALEGGGEHGALREAVARALSSLEAEQLLNIARERAGEPLLYSFPIPAGGRWTSAHLLVPPRGERRPEEGHEPPFHLVLGLELSRLGPVRAELVLAPASLSVRILVTRASAARRIETELAGLRARLGDGRRALDLRVRRGTPAEVLQGLGPRDMRYLREHHLLNVAG
jgi:hypothetical protein